MSWRARLRNVFRKEHLNDELDAELAFHVAETIDNLIAGGVPEEEAEWQARRRLGNYSGQKEKTRDMDVMGWLESTLGDVSYGLRQLKLNPGFAAVAVLSLALGIGANTAIFQLLDALRLRGLPVRNPSELVTITPANQQDFFVAGKYVSREQAFTYAQMDELRKRQKAFSDMLLFLPRRFNLSSAGRSRYAEGLLVSTNYLKVLGVGPVLGREFAPENDKVACSTAGAILSYSFWQSEFGGDRNVIGRNITLDGHAFPIAGVTPRSFFGLEPGERFDVAVPLCVDNLLAKDGKGMIFDRTAYWVTPIARLKPGWSVERAAKHIGELSRAIFAETVPAEYRPDFAKAYRKNKLTVQRASGGVSGLRQQYAEPLWMLMAITGAVLLIACANLANLLLARATAREREIAVRQAVGASRWRLFSQLLTESVLLAMAGALLGLGLAEALSRALVRFLVTQRNPITFPTDLNWHIFAFLALLAILTCILFGLAPAMRASSGTPVAAMRGVRTTTASRERNALRRTLVVAQIALSLVLLVAALLFTRSLRKLLATDLGFDSSNVLVANFTANRWDSETEEKKRVLRRELEDGIRSAPGVSSAATALFTPFGGFGWNSNVHTDEDHSRSDGPLCWFNRVGPGYFATLGTPLLAGRDFRAHDDLNAPKVAIVNTAFMKHLFKGKNPVGRTFRVESAGDRPDEVYQIVGVVRATTYNDAKQEPDLAFFATAQDPQPGNGMTFVVRGKGNLEGIESEIQAAAAKVDPTLLVDYRVLAVQVRDSEVMERLMANLSAAFGVLAGCLSTLGLYGVMSYLVIRRRSEIGVRLALGASRRNVYGLIAKDASRMVLVGVAVGVGVSLLLGRFAQSLLFGLKGNDPISLLAAAALLASTAAFATLIPARRAAGVEPTMALREE